MKDAIHKKRRDQARIGIVLALVLVLVMSLVGVVIGLKYGFRGGDGFDGFSGAG